MSKASVIEALRKAREAQEGKTGTSFSGSSQSDFNKAFYSGGKADSTGMSQKLFNQNFYAGKS
ncbi:hypothetical protein [Escherichia coli]|uniref:hypothetical protein n=1 Tax=Escherichia coli TaxID=562 RepID=UPI000BE7D1D4|nr:hypothetical protein [Escherichia coli]ELW6172340.1 hypothetical protein [Escherichia coli]